ncbi:MAG: hypothetical protein JSS07_05890 [Proteobacteria bacterium]|nr:hypothetical protein [Pseudomonadota bacterium]
MISFNSIQQAIQEENIEFFTINKNEIKNFLNDVQMIDKVLLELMTACKQASATPFLKIFFVLTELNIDLNKSEVLYQAGKQVTSLKQENSKLFIAFKASGVFGDMNARSDQEQENRIAKLFYLGKGNLKATQEIAGELLFLAAQEEAFSFVKNILSFKRPLAFAFNTNTFMDYSSRTTRMTMATNQEQEKANSERDAIVKVNESFITIQYKDQDNKTVLHALVDQGKFNTIKEICKRYPELKGDKEAGRSLLELAGNNINIANFIIEFYELPDIKKNEQPTPILPMANLSKNDRRKSVQVIALKKFLQDDNSKQFQLRMGQLPKDTKEEFIQALIMVINEQHPTLNERLNEYLGNKLSVIVEEEKKEPKQKIKLNS